MKRSLNILHTVEFYPPSMGGSQEAVRQISERLIERGHKVTVATTDLNERRFSELNGVDIKQFAINGNLVKGLTGEVDRYRQMVKTSAFDVMLNYGAQVWSTDALLEGLSSLKSQNVLVPVGFSQLHNPLYSDYFIKMKDWIKQYSACVYLSNSYRDIMFARDCGATNSIVIPNGADEREFDNEATLDIRKRLGIPANDFLILLVGTHTGLKGHEEAIQIFRHAHIGNATLLIVANDQGRGCGLKCSVLYRLFGSDPRPRMARKKLLMADLTREETVAAYKAADLFLFPSKVECSPLVLFEAMAAGIPFLSTDAGNATEIVEWSGGGQIMPTDKDPMGYSLARIKPSARLLENLYHDADWRDKLGKSGREAWKKQFTWEKIAERYEQLYFSLIDGTFKGDAMRPIDVRR